VEKGIRAYETGQYDQALKEFDEAKKELPSSAAVEFNRGNALFKLGRKDEAQEAYDQVTQTDRTDLREKDYYNLGNAWAELGKPKEAIAAYRKALTLDPGDQQARHNLEVMLRAQPPQSSPDAGTNRGRDGGSPDAGDGGPPPDQKRDGGSEGERDGGQGGGKGDRGRPDAGMDGGSRENAGGQDSKPEDRKDGGWDGGEEAELSTVDAGSPSEARLNKAEAERLLDAMKQNEKNLQLWRFQPKKPRKQQNEKDW
jgi:tetratricopeptide (TPR) repeat protein